MTRRKRYQLRTLALLLSLPVMFACDAQRRDEPAANDRVPLTDSAAGRVASAMTHAMSHPTQVTGDTVAVPDTVNQVDPTESSATLNAASALDPAVTPADMDYLRSRGLLIPVPGVRAADLPNTFDEARAGGERRHDAIDILAPRGTPVLSVDRGRVVRLDTSDRGGLSLYVADPSGRFMYYYAHLDAYRRGLHDDQPVARGDTLGYVGTTGNAPPNTPHLHFAIALLGDPKRWWAGTAINPWLLLAQPR